MEAVDEAVSPALVEKGVPGDLRIGVGIEAGRVVITRIGLNHAYETTAYGSAVNHAAKFCGRKGDVMIAHTTKKLYPASKGGTMNFIPINGVKDALKIKYPAGYRALRQPKPAA